MLKWVPFDKLNAAHLRLLAKTLEAQPKAVRLDHRDVLMRLSDGRLRLFEFEQGIVLCHHNEGRLYLDAISCDKLGEAWKLVDDVRKLAADWLCDTIATTAFDRRLADGIVKLGGKVESWNLTLETEVGNEQH